MKKFYPKKSGGKSEAGFTLIEALVAILIMAMGLIGLALMQAQGLKFTSGAYSRTQASMLANDIIDRMRVHSDEILRQDSAGAPELSDYIGDYVAQAEALDVDSGSCTAAGTDIEAENLVLHNVACWKDSLAEHLGAGSSGTIVFANDEETLVNVTINWTERAITPCDDCDRTPVPRSLSIVTDVNPIVF